MKVHKIKATGGPLQEVKQFFIEASNSFERGIFCKAWRKEIPSQSTKNTPVDGLASNGQSRVFKS